MKKVINLKWAKDERPDHFNFGDELGPYIVKKLSGAKIKYIYYYQNRINSTKAIIYNFIKFNFKSIKFFDYLYSLTVNNYLITVGSILYYSSNRTVVWGSGIISSKESICRHSKYLAVRGYKSLNKLREMGIEHKVAIGDPALLLPLIYKPKLNKKYKLGVIPHYIHYNEIVSKYNNMGVKIINLNSPNVEKTIDEICSCEYIISTSLHGIIVPHSYGIKSIWCKLSDAKLAGDDVKFYDYFSSVGISDYEPYIFSDLDDLNQIIRVIDNSIHSLPLKDIKDVQRDLLSVVPFEINNINF